jgi:uncharacterized membrane protein YfcA
VIEDPAFLAVLAVSLVAVGVVAGILAGLLGVGGGIVIVPVLFHVFGLIGIDEDVKMHLAVGTSLATIIPTSISSMRAHMKKGAVDKDLLLSWGPWIAVGVIAGTVLAGSVRGGTLTAVFGTIALIVALHMAFGKESWRVADAPPSGPGKGVIASLIGGFSVMMGIGGGTIAVPTLVLFNYPVHKAVGTASAIGLIIGVPGTIGFVLGGLGHDGLPPFSLGYLSLVGFALLTPTTVLFAPYGARIAHAIDRRALRRVFALFLAITSARMFWQILT